MLAPQRHRSLDWLVPLPPSSVDWMAYKQHLFLTVVEIGKFKVKAPGDPVFGS